MKKLAIVLAALPAFLVTGAHAQTVGEDVTKALWCGEAMVIAFSNAPSDATSDQLAQAQVYIDGGNAVIAAATQKPLDAGFTEEQVTKVKTDLVAEITPIVTGNGAGAKYSFEECAALLPGTSSEAPADASSSAAQ